MKGPRLDARAWLVLAGRLLTSFTAGIASLALVTLAVRQLGGVSSGVIVASAAAVGVLIGTYVGGVADFVFIPKFLVAVSVAGVVTAGTGAALIVTGAVSLIVISALMLVLSCLLAMASRAETAALVRLVDSESLPRVFGAVAARTQVAGAAAGLVSGLLVSASFTATLAVDAVAWLVCAVFAFLLLSRYPKESAESEGRVQFRLRELTRGYGFVFRTWNVLAIVLVSAFANLFLEGAAIIIELELIASGTDLILVGLLGTATGVAALLGSLVSGPLSGRLSVRSLFALVLGVLGVALGVCAFVTDFWVILIALSIGVFFIPALGVSAATSIARLTPMILQARVSGANAAISLVSTTLSPPVFGGLLSLTTRTITILTAAVGTAVASVVSLIALRKKAVGRNPDEGSAH